MYGVRGGGAVHLVPFNFEHTDGYQCADQADMANGRQSQLAEIADGFTGRSNWISSVALVVDWSLYIAAITTAVVVSAIWVKLLAAIIAGTAISMLFILGHDAAHRSLVTSKRFNAVLARLVFLPCLHNLTLWVIQHNRLHHQQTNVKGVNSYSPLSPEEFSGASISRRTMERVYRSPAGFGVYYLIERWWKDKFFPRSSTPVEARTQAWLDFALLFGWVCLLGWLLIQLDAMFGDWGPHWALFWGFVVPFLVWNQLMGTTAFLQHTHPLVPWFLSQEEARAATTQAEVTVLVQYPAWYDLLSHNIMQHQAHHVSARIPWFRLKAAQRCLTPVLGPGVVVERMSFSYVMKLVSHCRLYDYASNKWVPYVNPRSRAKTRKLVSPSQDFARVDQLSLRHVDKSGHA